MITFLISFAGFGCFIGLMAIGLLFGKSPVKRGCTMDEHCYCQQDRQQDES